ncbi:MAG: acyltransferase domain-containing protein [Treponema sp.]|jgi:hypothetical protein|nr:acyltransferase domain-containing protein [Treponema sp.]
MKIDHSKIRSLCEEIKLPDEVIDQIVTIIPDIDFSIIEEDFHKLFSLETGDEAYKNIAQKLKENAFSLKPLAVYLAAALKTWEIYEKLGIPRIIYADTMKMFARFVNEHLETYHFYGFDRDFWIYRILSASLFRLGTLEFEMKKCAENDRLEGYAAEGDKIISVHIPSDAVMTRENLDKSYKISDDFFKKYFPEYGGKIIHCRTWLLDPALKNLLPEKSKIINFQSDYKIINTSPEESEFIMWVYKKKYDNYELLPEDTTLQRNMKKHLLSGGKISLATGVKI